MSKKLNTIVLSGAPGVGKTTLIREISRELGQFNIVCQGFYTEEVRENARRIGFDVVTFSGKRDMLSRESQPDSVYRPKVGKYAVHTEKFEALVLPLLSSQISVDNQLIIVDEVGKMELISKKFEAAVNSLLDDTSKRLLVTVPLSGRHNMPVVKRICSSGTSKLFTITKENRNQIKQDIVLSIKKMLH